MLGNNTQTRTLETLWSNNRFCLICVVRQGDEVHCLSFVYGVHCVVQFVVYNGFMLMLAWLLSVNSCAVAAFVC